MLRLTQTQALGSVRSQRHAKGKERRELALQAPLPPPAGARPEGGGGPHQSGSFPRRPLPQWKDQVPGGRLLQGLAPARPGSGRWESLQARPWESSSRGLPPGAPETPPEEAALRQAAGALVEVLNSGPRRPFRLHTFGPATKGEKLVSHQDPEGGDQARTF